MSKKTKTAVAEAAVEPIVANGIEFTPKMIEDLMKIAEHQDTITDSNKTCKELKDKYKLFFEENEAAFRTKSGIRIGNLRMRLEVSRTLKIEIID